MMDNKKIATSTFANLLSLRYMKLRKKENLGVHSKEKNNVPPLYTGFITISVDRCGQLDGL